jgi:hypothetical protein
MLDKGILEELQLYVDRHLRIIVSEACSSPLCSKRVSSEEMLPNELIDYITNKRKPTFNQVLFSFIDKSGATDSEIYKKAGIDRRHFSKIRSHQDYKPGKSTAISLALALELDKDETDKLLSSAGYSLSNSDTFDLVIQFCLERKIYDTQSVNAALDYLSLKPLIGVSD